MSSTLTVSYEQEIPRGKDVEPDLLQWQAVASAVWGTEWYGSDADGRRGEKRVVLEEVTLSDITLDGVSVAETDVPPVVWDALLAPAYEKGAKWVHEKEEAV